MEPTKIQVEWGMKEDRLRTLHTVKVELPDGNVVSSFGRDENRVFITLLCRIGAMGYFAKVIDPVLNEIEVVKVE